MTDGQIASSLKPRPNASLQRIVTLDYCALYKYAYLLTYLLRAGGVMHVLIEVHTSGQGFDGTVSHVADWDVLQLVDVVVAVAASSRTELHLNRVRVSIAVAVSGGTRHAHRNTDRACSGGCSR